MGFSTTIYYKPSILGYPHLQMCGFACLNVIMKPVVYATKIGNLWTDAIFEAYWTNSHLRQKHVEVVSSCNKNWKSIIKQCISCDIGKATSQDGSYAESQVAQHVPELMHIDIVRPGQQRQTVSKASSKILLLCFRRDSDMEWFNHPQQRRQSEMLACLDQTSETRFGIHPAPACHHRSSMEDHSEHWLNPFWWVSQRPGASSETM